MHSPPEYFSSHNKNYFRVTLHIYGEVTFFRVFQRSQGNNDRHLNGDGSTGARAAGSDRGTQNGGDIIVHTTFGLEKEAETWLRDELQQSQDSYLRQPPTYTPLQCKQDGKIPLKHMREAFVEFTRRFGSSPSSDKTPSVVQLSIRQFRSP